MRVRWWHVGSVVAAALVVVLGFAAAWLVRKPAPAPAGMAARLEAEQRAFIESVWPEGEAAWPLLERALAAEGEERIELAIEASKRVRLFESLDALPSAPALPWSLAPMPNMKIRSLTQELDVAMRHAIEAGDGARASELLGDSLRLHELYLQHTGLITTMAGVSGPEHTFDLLADALRQMQGSEAVFDALVCEIRTAAISDVLRQWPTVEADRLETQRQALAMRVAMRDTALDERIIARLRSLRTRPDGFDQGEYFIDDWLLWTLRHDAESFGRALDDYHDAVAAWWETPALERSRQPDYPDETGDGPWLAMRSIWPNTRFSIDKLAMQEAGVILLLRIEAYHARTGEWPRTLEDAAPAEEIIDPVTGRAFVYELVEDPAPGAWPFELRAPLAVEEYGRLMALGEHSRPVEALWREAVTITKEGEEE